MRRSTVARILRVNHGGEHGAIGIYRAQIMVAPLRCPELTEFLSETLSHEIEHRARFRALMPDRDSEPCRMMWLWSWGGAVLGLATGLAGRRAVLVCTEAVERTVHRHLDDQIRHIGDRDRELSSTIREIQIQEQGHLEFAVQGHGAVGRLDRALDGVIVVLTEALIWLSTQGDSGRLARELRG